MGKNATDEFDAALGRLQSASVKGKREADEFMDKMERYLKKP